MFAYSLHEFKNLDTRRPLNLEPIQLEYLEFFYIGKSLLQVAGGAALAAIAFMQFPSSCPK